MMLPRVGGFGQRLWGGWAHSDSAWHVYVVWEKVEGSDLAPDFVGAWPHESVLPLQHLSEIFIEFILHTAQEGSG